VVPEITLKLPRPVTKLHQCEISSICNLRCVYCISKDLKRPKDHMTRDMFEQVLVHVDYYVNKQLSQDEFNICGVGESTLHPDLVWFVKRAREVMGNEYLNFTTNGILFTEELAKQLAPYMSSKHGFRPGIFVSLHRPEKAKKAIDIAAKYGLLAGVSNDPALASTNWAGLIKDWAVTANPNRDCPWIREGKVMAFPNGDVTTCTNDIGYEAVVGNVRDPVGTWHVQPWSRCSDCDQQVAVKGYQQYPNRLPVV
jgi:hypothetical protein